MKKVKYLVTLAVVLMAAILMLVACDKVGEKVEHGDLYSSANYLDGQDLTNFTDDDFFDLQGELYQECPEGALPYNFLEKQGIVFPKIEPIVVKPGDTFVGIPDYPEVEYAFGNSYIFVNPDTEENDVYLFVTCRKLEEGAPYVLWKLKYILDDKDYNDLLFLGSDVDIRIQLFVKAMDEKYSPEIVYQNVISDTFLKEIAISAASTVATCVDSVDTSTGEVKLRVFQYEYEGGDGRGAGYFREDIYTINLKDGDLWEDRLQEGYTEQEILNNSIVPISSEWGDEYEVNTEIFPFDARKLSSSCVVYPHEGKKYYYTVPFENVGEYHVMRDSQYGHATKDEDDYNKMIEKARKYYEDTREKISQYYEDAELVH